MDYDLLSALIAFAFISSVTPGPNNLMLMSSGANFGFKRTIPHMLGIGLGFVLMVFLVGVGLMQVFDAYPESYNILKIASVSYLLFLTYKIATAKAPQENGQNDTKPLTFLQAASFQWVNPKGWTVALTAVSAYSTSSSLESVVLVAITFGIISLPVVTIWTVFGQQLRRMLTSQIRLRVFNLTMALLLLATLYPVLVLN